MIDHSSHVWLHGESSRDRREELASWGPLPLLMPVVDAHRRRRGPYTAGGTILRTLVPGALDRFPERVATHQLSIRAVAPELDDLLPPRRPTLEGRLEDDERILVPAPRRTLRVANGIAEFLLDCAPERSVLVVDNVHEADPTDRELLTVLARRIDPRRLVVVACSADPPPDGFAGRIVQARTASRTTSDEPVPPQDPQDRAAAYVESDCTLDDPRLIDAYAGLSPERRAELHDRRADELERAGEWSFRLGAIPFHREHGTDPEGAGAEALWTAVDHCVREGFLHAVVELGVRGLELTAEDSDLWWRFLQRTATAMAGVNRHDDARRLWDRARRASTRPAVHAAAAYGTAMLDARHPDPAQRDLDRAMGWINEAIAISTLLPDPQDRAFKLGFDRNGRALIELRKGRIDAALALVESAIDLAERDLPPGRHLHHRMVLHANRGQLLATLNRTKEALQEYDTAIAIDPDFPDYYLDRGNVRYAVGEVEGALADYETAMRLSPPLPEAYYNRAELRIAQGEVEGALADLDHVIELDPGYLDAYINRAGLRAAAGLNEQARADVAAGLAIDPDNAHLWSVLGQLEANDGRHAEAMAAFETALAADPELSAAWANRGSLRYDSGDAEGAVADLSRAIELASDDERAALHYNRAIALRALGREEEARADLRRARDLAPDDPDIQAAL
ncbi:tetratricopeptide repeat protein [Thermostaphylospora chromogena]|uniref:Tfp pilus assembly protein PilF n=1 Tax=Thermostaphylospora chromogena TaxID=35622 RepID=A0A1H1I6R3_9ACTN|nr:tetratricopeptide repeat protein [Thermostaphylospora chromogena]SDR33249.1 Tfp pilus assembly protein PilF [Thermostaphylospora chromogena]